MQRSFTTARTGNLHPALAAADVRGTRRPSTNKARTELDRASDTVDNATPRNITKARTGNFQLAADAANAGGTKHRSTT